MAMHTESLRTLRKSLAVLCAVLADLVTILGGFSVAALLTGIFQWQEGAHRIQSTELFVTLIVFLGLQVSLGSYRPFRGLSPSRRSRIALRSYLYGVLMVCSIMITIQRQAYFDPQFVLSIFLLPIVYTVVRPLLHLVTAHIQKADLEPVRTLVIGEDALAQKIVSWLKQMPGYDLVDVISSPFVGGRQRRMPDGHDIEDRIVNEQIDLLLLSPASMNGSKEYLEHLCRTRQVHVRIIPPEIDVLFTRTAIDDLMGIPLVMQRDSGVPRGTTILKRVIDLAGAVLLSVLLSPLLLGVAVATKLESRGPVLFRQRRCLSGTDRVFDIYKFRSMTAEADRDKVSLRNESSGALFKLREDPRVTRVGRFIRRYSIDELPQLINIFRGEMSLVGPRPLPVEDFARISEEDTIHSLYGHRSAMKPGLTGLWQISGRSDLGFLEMVLLDIYYIENHTHLFDLEIMLRTIPAVLTARGAY